MLVPVGSGQNISLSSLGPTAGVTMLYQSELKHSSSEAFICCTCGNGAHVMTLGKMQDMTSASV